MLMERAGSGSNWLGKDFFQKTVLQGGFRKAGTSPHGSKPAMLKHAVGSNTHQEFPWSPQQQGSNNTEVLASSDPAGLPDSLANDGESSQVGGLALRGGYCS